MANFSCSAHRFIIFEVSILVHIYSQPWHIDSTCLFCRYHNHHNHHHHEWYVRYICTCSCCRACVFVLLLSMCCCCSEARTLDPILLFLFLSLDMFGLFVIFYLFYFFFLHFSANGSFISSTFSMLTFFSFSIVHALLVSFVHSPFRANKNGENCMHTTAHRTGKFDTTTTTTEAAAAAVVAAALTLAARCSYAPKRKK